jgi:LysR family hydrogen peroxide-inducible transcriptional activator
MSALPTLRQLRYLVELAERLNFRQAAEALFVTQSTLSAGVKELESVLGVTLVERDQRTVRLTPLGAEVVERARTLLAAAEDLVGAVKGAAAPLAGSVRLGVIPTIAPFLLPTLLPSLRAKYPALRLFLREDQTARLIERLEAGQLDFALLALPYDTGNLLVRTLFQDEFWYVAREDDPAAKRAQFALRDLDPGRILLLEEGHCLRDHAITACGARGRSIAPEFEATSLPTLVQMVEGGLGATLLPEMTVKAGILRGTKLLARPFTGRAPARTIALAARATTPLKRDFDLLADLIEEQARRAGKAGVPALRRSASQAKSARAQRTG